MKTETIKGDWIMEKDEIVEGNLIVKGNITGENGRRFHLTVIGDLNCGDLTCGDLNCWDLNCWDLNCRDLTCWDLNCGDLNFYAVAIAYNSFKCKSWKARRDNYVIKSLDGEIEVTG